VTIGISYGQLINPIGGMEESLMLSCKSSIWHSEITGLGFGVYHRFLKRGDGNFTLQLSAFPI